MLRAGGESMNRASAYALACAALAAACSSEPNVGSTATALDFCKTSQGISLDNWGQCQKAAPAVMAMPQPSLEAYCSTVQAEVDARRVVYDAARGGSCARALASLTPCALLLSSGQPYPEECLGVLTGMVALGSACSESLDCASGYCNAPLACGGRAVPGQCVAFLTQGEPCSGGACAAGLQCDFTAATPVCVPLSAEGGACPCQAGLYCDTSGAAPVCKALKTSGSCSAFFAPECAPSYECVGYPDASCVPYVGLGASCGAAGVCGPGYQCDSGSGVCVAQPTVGQACVVTRAGTTAQLWCIGGWCDAAGTKMCQPLKADGEPCTSLDQCVGSCDTSTQTCKALQPPGCATPL
jgi:hypothetical protein